LFTAALDDRVRAAVVVGFTFEFNNWLKYAGTHCTCTHLPGMFRGMEWFEIAGLIAPRALMMLQGDQDGIFPISGARRAGHNTEALYRMLGQPAQARFSELPGQPHAYSRPYREFMYGWMAGHLLHQGNGEPIAENNVRPLDEQDSRLLCDPSGSVMQHAPTVVDLARERAMEMIARLPESRSAEAREAAVRSVRELTAPPELPLHYLAPQIVQRAHVPGGWMEKISFVSEDGEPIPGLLWLPQDRSAPARTVVIVDSRGKQAVAESGFVQPLIERGLAVLAIDLRGRGETLGLMRPGWNTNFRLVASQVEFGQPLAGRRAFDLMRALDYAGTRKELAAAGLSVVGLGDDALPALLAAAQDTRIRSLAVAGYLHSFVSQMRTMATEGKDWRNGWNDAQLTGSLKTPEYEVDFGSVIPRALASLDVPDIVALIAPRKVLFCQAQDAKSLNAQALTARFRQIAKAAGAHWIDYAPDQTLDIPLLSKWLLGGTP